MAHPPRHPRMDQPAPGFPVPSDPTSKDAQQAAARKVAAARWRAVQAMLCDTTMDHSAVRIGCLIVTKYINGQSGWAWPSLTTLAAGAGMSRSTAIRALKPLTDRGHILAIVGGGRLTGSESTGRSSRYTIDWERLLDDAVPSTTPSDANDRDGGHHTVSPANRDGVMGASVRVPPAQPEHPLPNIPIDLADRAREREGGGRRREGGVVDAAARQAIAGLRHARPTPNVELLRQQREADAADRRQREAAARAPLDGMTARDAARLRQAIDTRGVSLADVAERARVTETALRRMLDDGQRLSATDRWRLKDVLTVIEREPLRAAS